MKLKNEALQKLYDDLMSSNIVWLSPYTEAPADKMFKDCDEKLSESVTFEEIRNLQNRIDMLQQDHESDVRVIGKLHSQMVDLEDEKTEQEKRADILKSQRDMLKKELDGAIEDKKSLVVSRYKWAQKWLSTKQNLETKLNEAEVKYRRLEKEHEKLTSEYQTITIENKRLQDGLRGIGYEQGQTDLWDALQNVNDSQPNEFDVECESMHDVIGMDLEDFLDAYKKWQEQKDIDRMRDYLERFCLGRLCYYCPLYTDGFNCSRGKWMAGIPDKDVKRYYEKAREEQKETDRMRDWLTDFCWERVCEGCPLESKEYKCGCGYSFRKTDSSDLRIIPDKDIKRYYEKARGCGRYTLNDGKLFATPNMEGVNKAITEACKNFCKAVRDADIKITENVRRNSWECTLEANVEVNKDLLDKFVCGIVPVEEEHKFEYGDAVRVSWRTYDYMYIGTEEKHIRLFNPKTHEVVFVSPSEKLTYQGCKIILTDEEDLKKIWKDKK